MKNIDNLLARWLAGEATKEERNSIEKWLKADAKNQILFDRIKLMWEVSKVDHSQEGGDVFKKTWERANQKKEPIPNKRIQRSLSIYFKIAASLLILLVSSILIFNYYTDTDSTISDTLTEIKYVIKENKSGQKSRVFLPDGSMVWLNALSKITYKENFDDSVRLVELTGEAFFEVRRDVTKAFVVKSGNARITALGTKFNVNAYKDTPSIKVALTEGKVLVDYNSSIGQVHDELILLAGEMAIASEEFNPLVKRKFESDIETGWKDGILWFKDADFGQVIKTLERWYGVSFKYTQPPAGKWRFSGSFENENLINVLQVLNFSENIEFKVSNDTVFLRDIK